MLKINLKSEIEGQYDVVLRVSDMHEMYCVIYGDEHLYTESLTEAINFYDECTNHQRNYGGVFKGLNYRINPVECSVLKQNN